MELIEHYLKLQNHFSDVKIGTPIPISREELASLLFCSERNVVHIIQNLHEKKWIHWKSGRGRGNVSAITFMIHQADLIKMESHSLIRKGSLSKLLYYISTYLLDQQKQELLTQLPHLFGYNVIRDKEQTLDILTFPYFRHLFSLDPAYVERQTERHMVSQLFNTLVGYDAIQKKIEPKIAHYWQRNDNATVWTFYLRKGIQFHHQQELTSDDVVFSFKRLIHTPSAWIIKGLQNVSPIDRYTVQFMFEHPNFVWLDLLTSPKASIVPNNLGDKSAKVFSRSPIGTGPYKISEHTDQTFVLDSFHQHFQGRPHLDRIMVVFLPKAQEDVDTVSLKEKLVHYYPFLVNQQDGHDFNHVTRKHLSIKFLMWNMNRNVHSEQVRKVFSTSIHKLLLVDALRKNRQAPTDYFSKIEWQESNPIFHDIYNIHLTVMTYDLTPNIEDLYWLRDNLKVSGIHLTIKIVSYSDFLNSEINRGADLLYSEYVMEDNEVSSLINVYQSPFSMVVTSLDTQLRSKVEALIQATKEENNTINQRKGILTIEDLLLKNNILIPVYSTSQKAFFHKSLVGATLNNVGLVPFHDLFFLKDKE
ncbi:ABC transporter substrate-binding protein [Bacillus salitolerans]|uniref:ABC transporter substrate-binding protein n=1 Tax=Bacillus salitolerans TaxID=1437434 RepID=A0ABW4LK57_9BACI